MTFTAGSIKEVSLGRRIFQVPAGCDAKVDLGGFVSNNEVFLGGGGVQDKHGQWIIQPHGPSPSKAFHPWSIEGLELGIDHETGDLQWLHGLQQGEPFDVTIALADDTVYGGVGSLTDRIQYSTRSGTATVSLGGAETPEPGRTNPGLVPL
jgi:hypothetical protein